MSPENHCRIAESLFRLKGPELDRVYRHIMAPDGQTEQTKMVDGLLCLAEICDGLRALLMEQATRRPVTLTLVVKDPQS